jgi:hypothetical protein
LVKVWHLMAFGPLHMYRPQLDPHDSPGATENTAVPPHAFFGITHFPSVKTWPGALHTHAWLAAFMVVPAGHMQALFTRVSPGKQPQAPLITAAPATEQLHTLFWMVCPGTEQPQEPLMGTAPLAAQTH